MQTTSTSTLRVPSELALIAVSLAVALGFGRMFSDGSFFGPLALVILAVHAIAIVSRRQRLSLPLAAGTTLVVFLLVATWIFYLHTTRFGLPTSLTITELRSDLITAFGTFQEERAPVEPLRGFVVASAAGFAFTSFLADWSAFRLWAPFEAILLSAGLFVFSSVLGAETNQVSLTMVFLAAVLGFLLLHRVARQEVSARWVRGDSSRGTQTLLRLGAGLGLLSLVGAMLFAPIIPGARDEALLDWRSGTGGAGSRVTISPLVEIQSRLLEQSNVEVFTVRSSSPHYWRLTSLDDYDATSWSASRTYRRAGGALDPGEVGNQLAPESEVVQEFTIQNLSQVWLPAAYKPGSIDVDDARWDGASGTLIAQDETSDGLVYQVASSIPALTPELLTQASEPAPAEIREQYLSLPGNFSDRLRDEALDITASLGSPYEKALALQDYFRDGSFSYNVEVPAGQSEDFLEDFVFNSKQGYCVQYTTAYAVMARSIGLPTRVAVGFTQGDLVPGETDLYQVRGRQAHSWPEVYFTGVGWVGFEPTPGRGAPGATSYTGVSAQQDSLPAEDLTTPTTAVPGAAPIDTTIPGLEDFLPDIEGGGDAALEDAGFQLTGFTRVLLIAFVLGIAYAIVVPLSHRMRRDRRRRAAANPSERIDAAWVEATESLSVIGVDQDPAETPTEFADRAARRARLDSDEYRELADLTVAARYGDEDQVQQSEADRATEITGRVSTRIKEQVTIPQQAKSLLDPRPILSRSPIRKRD